MSLSPLDLMQPVRVMIVEDHGLIRALMERWLAEAPGFEVVGGVASGEAGLAQLAPWSPELVIVDLALPGMDGLEFIRQAREQFPQLRAMVISSMVDPLVMVRVKQAQVDGYLEKEASPQELLNALEAIAQGRTAFSEKFHQMIAMDEARGTSFGKILSRREQQVLDKLFQGQSNKAIAEALSLSIRTVEFHRANLMTKLDARSLAELLYKARAYGQER